jgi:hypothetical protein
MRGVGVGFNRSAAQPLARGGSDAGTRHPLSLSALSASRRPQRANSGRSGRLPTGQSTLKGVQDRLHEQAIATKAVFGRKRHLAPETSVSPTMRACVDTRVVRGKLHRFKVSAEATAFCPPPPPTIAARRPTGYQSAPRAILAQQLAHVARYCAVEHVNKFGYLLWRVISQLPPARRRDRRRGFARRSTASQGRRREPGARSPARSPSSRP